MTAMHRTSSASANRAIARRTSLGIGSASHV
jgi:hypothetical protein